MHPMTNSPCSTVQRELTMVPLQSGQTPYETQRALYGAVKSAYMALAIYRRGLQAAESLSQLHSGQLLLSILQVHNRDNNNNALWLNDICRTIGRVSISDELLGDHSHGRIAVIRLRGLADALSQYHGGHHWYNRLSLQRFRKDICFDSLFQKRRRRKFQVFSHHKVSLTSLTILTVHIGLWSWQCSGVDWFVSIEYQHSPFWLYLLEERWTRRFMLCFVVALLFATGSLTSVQSLSTSRWESKSNGDVVTLLSLSFIFYRGTSMSMLECTSVWTCTTLR